MSSAIRPSWTENIGLLTSGANAVVLARGSTLRGTLDLRTKVGAFVALKVGRGGTAALSTGVNVFIRATQNNDTAVSGGQMSSYWSTTSQTAAANASTVGADSAAGQNELKTAAITGWAVGDILCIQDAGGGVSRLEFGQISKLTVGSGTGVTLNRPLAFTHTSAQADTVRNKADMFNEVWLEGGSLYDIVFDYGADATGDSTTCVAIARTYDYDLQVTV